MGVKTPPASAIVPVHTLVGGRNNGPPPANVGATLVVARIPASLTMKINRTHSMTKDDAKRWADGELSDLLNQFGDSVSDVSHAWKGDTMRFAFRAGGMFTFKGALKVSDDALNLDLPFPLLARGFEGGRKPKLKAG